MLEQSTRVLDEATPAVKAAAEEMALAMMASHFIQDLIPVTRAVEIAEEHRNAKTEDWQRETFAALSALKILRARGSLQRFDI